MIGKNDDKAILFIGKITINQQDLRNNFYKLFLIEIYPLIK